MNLAPNKDTLARLVENLSGGGKPALSNIQPDDQTVDHITTLLRRNIRQGIVPKWSLKTDIGTILDPSDHNLIADQVEEGFASGQYPVNWRLDTYA